MFFLNKVDPGRELWGRGFACFTTIWAMQIVGGTRVVYRGPSVDPEDV